MNKITSTLLAIALAGVAFAADPPEAPKKSDAELLYEKLLAENTKEADKQYGEYLAALAKANEAIIKKLEIAKADLNNPKKGNLSIVERAAAIAEIDAKILEVKKNGVGEAIVAGRSSDLLGEGKPDLASMIVGTWVIEGKVSTHTFMNDGTVTEGNKFTGKWKKVDDTTITFVWTNGNPTINTVVMKIENNKPILKVTFPSGTYKYVKDLRD